ncbi:MAG: hypothetical protein K9I71_01025 [Ignavibacteriales bacterium]|nr:hypothetical protein [Ignavibacteriales bacterium]MCF8314669.1 hypothetical protein [Ignavibacteriales bacterium]MCF8436294.1 hypothetical protein [Ignavibacteriales bacterium]
MDFIVNERIVETKLRYFYSKRNDDCEQYYYSGRKKHFAE